VDGAWRFCYHEGVADMSDLQRSAIFPLPGSAAAGNTKQTAGEEKEHERRAGMGIHFPDDTGRED